MDYKAFVSSTFLDLKQHRARAIEALRRSGIFVDPMEDWTADSSEPRTVSTERMRDCDLCVLLVGARRGHVPVGERLSIVQLEYLRAVELGLDVLVFLYDGESAWPPVYYELDRDSELQRWRAELREQRCIATFTNDPTTLDAPLRDALARWIQSQAWPEIRKTYVENLAAAYASVRFLGIGVQRNAVDRPIEEVFVQPRAATRHISPDIPVNKWPDTLPIDDLVQPGCRVVLLGDPGSGKSTIVSWLTFSLARPDDNPLKARMKDIIPLPLILRELDLTSVHGFKDLLEAGFRHWSLRLLGRRRYASDLDELLHTGKVLFLLDGLDEISNPRQRRALATAIAEGMAALPACGFLLASRIVGFDDVRATLVPAERELRYVAPFDDTQIRQFANNWYNTRERSKEMAKREASNLVDAIAGNEGTQRLARIPHLLTMMALIHRAEADLPNGRALLYTKIADAYVQSLDEHRHIERLGYSLLEQTRFLGRIAFEMQRQRSSEPPAEGKEILASGREVRQWLRDAMRSGRAAPQEGDETALEAFLDDVCRRSGILVPKGEDLFAFAHLSFQEYFAATQLLQQFKLPQRKIERGEGLAGASRSDLAHYAGWSVWKETLILLVELTAAKEPDFVEDLAACLFGEAFERLVPRDDPEAQLRLGALTATLAVNPHSGLREAGLREAAMKACCELELAYQASKPLHERGGMVLPALFRSSTRDHEDVWRVLVDGVQRRRTTSLEFIGTTLNDASPLGACIGLRGLAIDGTGVSDLSVLSPLRSLRALMLGWVPDLRLETLPDLPDLQLLSLHGSRSPDLRLLKKVPGLIALSISGVERPVKLLPLLELPRLKYLIAQYAAVEDFAVLSRHPSLEVIAVDSQLKEGALGSRVRIDHKIVNFSEIPEVREILESL